MNPVNLLRRILRRIRAQNPETLQQDDIRDRNRFVLFRHRNRWMSPEKLNRIWRRWKE